MTQEQFEKAIKANEKLKQLKRVLDQFQIHKDCRLSLIYGDIGEHNWKYKDLHHVDGDITWLIKDKLKNYTERFIKELNEEVEEINKEIEKI